MPEIEGKGVLFVWWLPAVLGAGALAAAGALYLLTGSRILRFFAVPLGLVGALIVIFAMWTRFASR